MIRPIDKIRARREARRARNTPPEPNWRVRVTRDLDQEYAEVDVHAGGILEAKERAVAMVQATPDSYFDAVPPPRYYVSSRDEPEPIEEE